MRSSDASPAARTRAPSPSELQELLNAFGLVLTEKQIIPSATVEDIDFRAVREALVNAVIHRDYAITGSQVLLEAFDDRIVEECGVGRYRDTTSSTPVTTTAEQPMDQSVSVSPASR